MSFGKLTDGFQADFTAALALQGKKPTNEVFQECMKVLKDHKVSYTVVDELFPAFAKLAMKALNTSNHVGIAQGELETQLQLSDLVDDNGFTEKNKKNKNKK